MWDVLKDYPAARVRLEAVAVKRLEKYKRAPLDKGKFHTLCCLFGSCIEDYNSLTISIYYWVITYRYLI